MEQRTNTPTIEVTQQMNSDIFENIETAYYDISGFLDIELKQAKQSFLYNGYKYSENPNFLTVVKKKS